MAYVLVVEDDRDFCESLRRFLSTIGHTTACEGDGRSALKTLIARDPDVILLDLKLPVMDGVTFLKVMRSYVRFRNLPVFVMTGVSDDATLDAVTDAGVNQVFTKGQFEFGDIRRAIESATMH